MTSKEEQVKLIIQGMVEQGELEYFNDDSGKLCLKKGKNYGKVTRPDIIAGKKIRWIEDK